MLWGTTLRGLLASFCCGGGLSGWSSGLGWSLVWLVAKPCLVWMLLADVQWGLIIRQQIAEPQWDSRLVPVHCCADSGSKRLWSCCPFPLFPHWWMKPDAQINARLMAGIARFWNPSGTFQKSKHLEELISVYIDVNKEAKREGVVSIL